MTPVGNDIVDLKTAGALGKAGDRRFVERVLTPGELAVLGRRQYPDALLWAFWAAKEAAYKAISKTVPRVSSAPRRYGVTIDFAKRPDTASGCVTTPCGIAPIRIYFHKEFIHCIASADCPRGLTDIRYGWQEIAPGGLPVSVRESQAVRKAAIVRIAAFLSCDPDDVRIIRTTGPSGQGPPRVHVRNKSEQIDVSLSHDGRFVAYAFRA